MDAWQNNAPARERIDAPGKSGCGDPSKRGDPRYRRPGAPTHGHVLELLNPVVLAWIISPQGLAKFMLRQPITALLWSSLICWGTLVVPAANAQWPLQRGGPEATGALATSLPETLDVLWDYQAEAAFEATPVVSSGKIYAADTEGAVYCLELSTGKLNWKTKFDSGFLASPAIQDNTLVVGDYDGFVYALSATDGKQIWKFEAGGQIDSGASFFNSNVLVASQDGVLNALDIGDGHVVWQYETSDQIRCSPTVAGKRTFLGGCDSQLHVIDLSNGKSVGNPLPIDSPTNGTPAVVGTVAYLPTYAGQVLAIDWSTGKRVWQYEDQERQQEYRSSAAVSDRVLVASSQAKRVVGIERSTGKLLWQMQLRRRADASPVIAGQSVFLAATDGRLYRINLLDGKPTWTYEVKGSLLSSPAIADNRIVLTTEEGHILCFGAK